MYYNKKCEVIFSDYIADESVYDEIEESAVNDPPIINTGRCSKKKGVT